MKNHIRRVVIISNGQLRPSILKLIHPGDFVIGVDRAAYWLIDHGIIPQVAIGDFDSTTREEMKEIRKKVKIVLTHPSQKDETDTELALKYAVNLKPESIDMYGAFGTRMDHTIASVLLLEPYSSHNIQITAVDNKNRIQFVENTIVIKKDASLPYFSVVPVSTHIVISIYGCKYPVVKATFKRGQTIGISNETLSKQTVLTLHSGKVLVIQSRD